MYIRVFTVESIGIEYSLRRNTHSGVDGESVEVVSLENDTIEESIIVDVIFPNSLDVSIPILTSLLTITSEVVIIGLENIPSVITKSSDVSCTLKSVLRDHCSFIWLSSSNDKVHWHYSVGIWNGTHQTSVVITSFYYVSCCHCDFSDSNVYL